MLIIKKRELHFTTLNYASDYTLHPKLFERTLCTPNYHPYHTLHPGVTFTLIFNGILLHMTNTCILFRWNKLKRMKHPFSKSIKTKAHFFPHLPPCLMCMPASSPNSDLVNPLSQIGDGSDNDVFGSDLLIMLKMLARLQLMQELILCKRLKKLLMN